MTSAPFSPGGPCTTLTEVGTPARVSGLRQQATTLHGLRRNVRSGAGTAVRVLRRRLSSARPANRRSNEEPRLLFRPGTGDWYVALEDRWYSPTQDADIDALVALLPLEVLDEQLLGSVKSSGGFVRVVEDNNAPTLEFLTSFGEVVRRTANLLPGLHNVVAEWESGAHDDGWIEAHATLRLDGVRRCTLVAYLPELPDDPDADGKQVAVQISAGRHTDVDIHRLPRGQETHIELYRSRRAARGLSVTLHTSIPEPADDARPLGFVAMRIETLA